MRETEGVPNEHCGRKEARSLKGKWQHADNFLRLQKKQAPQIHKGTIVHRKGKILMEKDKIEVTPEVVLQYREYEVNMEDVVERVKAHYVAKGHKRDSIVDLQVYVKPEDFTAYYVINDGVVGKVNLF